MSHFEQSDPLDHANGIAFSFPAGDAGSETIDLDFIGRLVGLEVAEPKSLNLSAILFHLVARLVLANCFVLATRTRQSRHEF